MSTVQCSLSQRLQSNAGASSQTLDADSLSWVTKCTSKATIRSSRRSAICRATSKILTLERPQELSVSTPSTPQRQSRYQRNSKTPYTDLEEVSRHKQVCSLAKSLLLNRVSVSPIEFIEPTSYLPKEGNSEIISYTECTILPV